MSGTTVRSLVEQMSGVINRYLNSNLNFFTATEIADTITSMERFQNDCSDEENADILQGYISQIISHLYVAEGYATDDVPRNIEYYRNMEAARGLFRQVKNLR